MNCSDTVSARVTGVPDFWTLVSRSSHRVLALDYDGTLAPFHVAPRLALPLPGIPFLLEAIHQDPGTTVAILSGRPVQEVHDLLGDIGVTLVGCHGFETIDPDGHLRVRSPSGEQLEAMTHAMNVAIRLGLKENLEVKTASIALHTRGMPPREASAMEEMITREWSLVSSPSLGCRRFNGGVEIFCPDWNKGDVMKDLLANAPPGTLTVYIGDDATDEDVFRIIRETGIGIRVGTPSPPTAAKGFLPGCSAVKAFLVAWLAVLHRK